MKWNLVPSPLDPDESWLACVDQQSSDVVVMLHPWCSGPLGLGRWRIAQFTLRDVEDQPDFPREVADVLADEVASVLVSLTRAPHTAEDISCEQALELAGETWTNWVIEETEDALQSLVRGVASAGSEEGVVVGEEVRETFDRSVIVKELFDDWVSCGGRTLYLRRLVATIDDRRAGLLDVMDEQPTALDEWLPQLLHRMVEHLSDVSSMRQLGYERADGLAWTAAMALEAAFVVAPATSRVVDLLADATTALEESLEHRHEFTEDWLAAASHGLIDMRISDPRRILADLLLVCGHLVSAIVQAGHRDVVAAGHVDKDDLR